MPSCRIRALRSTRLAADLNALKPGSTRQLHAVFDANRALIDEAASGRPQAAIRAMALEAELQADPAKACGQFVARWNTMHKEAERAYVAGDMAGRKAIQNQMAAMARSLERDPQLESILAGEESSARHQHR